MGFMAGFGPAFAEGVKKNTELREQRKDDAFKLTFAELSKRREKYSEDKKQDQADARKAKAFASMKDPAAFPKVLEWVKAGLSDEQIKENMQGTFKTSAPTKPAAPATPGSDAANPTAAPAQAMSTPSAPAADPAAQQTEQALGVKPAAAPGDQMVSADAPEDATASPNNKSLLSGMSGKFKGMTGNKFMRDAFGNGGGEASRTEAMTESRSAIANSLGIAPEEQEAVWNGYQSTEADASGIEWTPAQGMEEPDKINTLPEATIALRNAEASGDEEKITVARRRYNAVVEATQMQAEATAKASGLGTGGTYANMWEKGPNGEKRYLGRSKIITKPDGTVTDWEGNQIDPSKVLIREEDKIEMEEKKRLFDDTRKPIEEYNTQLNNYVGMVRDVGSLDKIYQTNPDAMQNVAPSAAAIIQDVANEVSALGNLADATAEDINVDAGDAIKVLSKQAEILAEREAKAQDPISKLANAKALADTKKALITYRLAASLGQAGKNLAETERKLFQGSIDASNYAQWKAKMAEILDGQGRGIEDQANTIKSGQIEFFRRSFDYIPNGLNVETPSERLSIVTEEQDPDLANGKKLLESKGGAKGVESPLDKAKRNSGVVEQKPEKYPEGTVISNGKQDLIRQGGKWVPVTQ